MLVKKTLPFLFMYFTNVLVCCLNFTANMDNDGMDDGSNNKMKTKIINITDN